MEKSYFLNLGENIMNLDSKKLSELKKFAQEMIKSLEEKICMYKMLLDDISAQEKKHTDNLRKL